MIRNLTLAALCSLAGTQALQAQFLITYQGAQGTDPTAAVYDTVTAQLVTSFQDPGVFKVLSTSTGTQHFFVSNTTGAAILAIGSFYNRGHRQFGTFTQPVTSAVLTPNDLNLVVGEQTVHIFSASSYRDLVPGGIVIPSATTVIDLAVDYDSQNVYALSAGVTQSFLTAINLTTLAITQTVAAPVGSTFLTIGPSGLLYISSPNTITEVNPATLATTPTGAITVPLASPGRPVFTPAGQYLIAADQSPVAGGSAAALVDVNLHAVAGTVPFNGLVDPITQFNVLSDTAVYAYIPGTTSLYLLQIGTNGGLILNVPPFAGNLQSAMNPGAVNDVASFITSPDLGVAGRNAPAYLFLTGAQSPYIYVIDPVSLSILNQIPWGDSNFGAPGAISYTVPTMSFNPVQTVFAYGNNQTVPLGGTTLPLVIRALDVNGSAIAGAGIDFFIDAPASGAPIDGLLTPAPPGTPVGNYTYVTTGADGYAEVFFTAGNLSTDVGPITISTDIGSAPPSFTVNVGTAAPSTAAALSIVSGQGQIIFQNPNPNPNLDPNTGLPLVPLFASTPLPLTVRATDGAGNPLPNATVVFTILSSDPLASPGASQTIITDSNGEAAATFPPNTAETPFSPPFAVNGFATETIAATTGTLSANFYLTSVPYAVVNSVGCATPPCTTSVPQLNVKVLTPAYGSVISGNANSTLQNAVQVVVTSLPYSLPIPNVGVSVNTGPTATLPNARCSEPTGSGIVLTDSTGTATCNLLLNAIPGSEPLSIFVPQQSTGAAGFATLTINPNPAAAVNIVTGNNQYGNEGDTLSPFTVQVIDAAGNPIPLTPISWLVKSGPLTLGSVATTTDTNGMAAATPIAGMTAGVATVTATAGPASTTLTATIGAPAGNILVVSGNNQTVPINAAAAAPLVVQVLDFNGNPAPFAGVTFGVSGTPALSTFAGTTPAGASSVTVVTDANGQASVSLIATSVPGPVTVTATATQGLASTFFSLTVLSPAPSSVQVLNAASLASSLSPGALITITGAMLTPTIQGTVSDPASLVSAGYNVSIGGLTVPVTALINQNGVQQINAQIPFEATTGATTLVVQTPQGSSSTDVTVNPLSPGIFTSGTVTVNGSAYPQANAIRSDGTAVSASNPAHQGESITFYATGMGQTTPTAVTGVTGVPGQVVYAPLFVAINHLGASVTSAVYEAGANGMYAVTLQISSTATTGPGQPISLYMLDSTGTGYTAPDVYIPIAP